MSSVWLAAFVATATTASICGIAWRVLTVRLRAVESQLLRRLGETEARLLRPAPPPSRTVETVIEPQVQVEAEAPPAAPVTRIDPPAPSIYRGLTLIEVPSIKVHGSEAIALATAEELARRFGSIWALEDAGATPEAIANVIDQPVGQVELILGLRRQARTPASHQKGERND